MFEVSEIVIAFAVAAVVTCLLTPLAIRIAGRVGAIDQPKQRGLAEQATPRLGGVAIFAGVACGMLIWLGDDPQMRAILIGATVIVVVGVIDDIFEISPALKLLGQIVAALIPVLGDVYVKTITLPFVGPLDLGVFGGPLTLLGIVAVMNVVNLTDGVDGLAAGVCMIAAAAFAVIAFDLGKEEASLLAALICGSALGFLVFNFHPASIFMGDSGSNLFGLLLASVAVQGTLKTNAVVALLFPLVVLAVPFLDTSFVVAKRIKYKQPIYQGDAWHFHHRFANIGFSQRKTVMYLYGWTLSMAALALALRFVPYSNGQGEINLQWFLVLLGAGLIAVAASLYLVVVLEILKFKRLRSWQLRNQDPETSEHQIEAEIVRELQTGEFKIVKDDR